MAYTIEVKEFKGLSFSSESIDLSNHADQINRIVQMILENDKAKELMKESLKNGPLTIKLSPPSPTVWPAHWDFNARTININISLSPKKTPLLLYTILFELANSVNPYFTPKTKESELVSVRAHETPESYARMMELAEFSTTCKVFDIYKFAQDNKLWTKDVSSFLKNPPTNFPDVWKSTNKKNARLSIISFRHLST